MTNRAKATLWTIIIIIVICAALAVAALVIPTHASEAGSLLGDLPL